MTIGSAAHRQQERQRRASLPDPVAELAVDGGSLVVERRRHDLVSTRPGARTSRSAARPATDLIVGTSSGAIECASGTGRRRSRSSSKSGNIEIERRHPRSTRATRRARSEVGECAGECRVVVTSGKVHVGRRRARLGRGRVRQRSGSTRPTPPRSRTSAATSSSARRVAAGSRSGASRARSRSRCPPAIAPATHLKSISGRVSSDCDEGTTARSTSRPSAARSGSTCQ